MNNKLLAQAVQDYINANLNADVNQIALAKSPFEGISQKRNQKRNYLPGLIPKTFIIRRYYPSNKPLLK